MDSKFSQINTLLQSLGLNRLESEVYIFLLQVSEPVTAYKIGTQLGRPTANVYKAIDTLTRKGAVMVDEGSTRLCRPIPPSEFMGHLRSDWLDKTRMAEDALAEIGAMQPDQGVYHLQSVPLVLEKCRTMLAGCRKIAVIDAFPKTMAAVLPAIEDAVARGVEVYLQTYVPCHLPGVNVVYPPGAEDVLIHWHSQQLNIVVDAKESLVALLDHDLTEVHQAVWTSSLYLACMYHCGLLREHYFHVIAQRMDDPDFPSDLKLLMENQPFFHTMDIPGQRELFDLCGIKEKLDESKT
ncbi:MAG: TrmB family transcriptional regulator [bacterium]|nr:TrmB family transcriptional regulator [bacterium]